MAAGRSRSRSPYRESHTVQHRRRDDLGRTHRGSPPPAKLPFNAHPLSKHDLLGHQPLFAVYLDIQKGIHIEDLSVREIKGRWKSFTAKWNHGDLAEGWYDPVTLRKARDSAAGADAHHAPPSVTREKRTAVPGREPPSALEAEEIPPQDDESDDDVGPAPLPSIPHTSRPGPSIPTRDELALRDELAHDDRMLYRDDLRHERKMDRQTQKERVEELMPRPEAGSYERKVEKRADVRAIHASFKTAKDSGDADVGDSDLMGDGGIDDYKKAAKDVERKKNEREIRREEIWRAKAAEREERMREVRAKEDKTMDFFKALAKEKFG